MITPMEPVTLKTDRSRPAPKRKSQGRSRVGNGSALLNRVDLRSVWYRRFKDLLNDHFSDIPDASFAESSILRRCSVIEVELETMEERFAARGHAEPEELDLYQRTASGLRRLLESVGVKRRPREIQQTLEAYLEQQRPRVIEVEAAE
jgi:hypothetical protein